MTFTQKLFSFQGRLRRQDFWICTLLLWVVGFVLSMIVTTVMGGGIMAALMASGAGSDNPDPAVAAGIMAAVAPMYGVLCVIGLAMLWPHLAVMVKRGHDRDQTGWMVLILLIPIVGWFFWLINYGILDGTPGPNQYGPSPKGLGESALAA
jgi:uncharacterized membrane protein YhaH (DUF805 family)